MACADIFFCVHFSITYKLLGTGTIVSSPSEDITVYHKSISACSRQEVRNAVIGLLKQRIPPVLLWKN